MLSLHAFLSCMVFSTQRRIVPAVYAEEEVIKVQVEVHRHS